MWVGNETGRVSWRGNSGADLGMRGSQWAEGAQRTAPRVREAGERSGAEAAGRAVVPRVVEGQ